MLCHALIIKFLIHWMESLTISLSEQEQNNINIKSNICLFNIQKWKKKYLESSQDFFFRLR